MQEPVSKKEEFVYVEPDDASLGDYVGQRPSLLLAFLSIAERYADRADAETVEKERH